ncbi:MAG: cation-translocating P-type ATPase [Pseudomonadota bacterium]
MVQWHNLTPLTTFQDLESAPEGLTSEEAARRLQQFGPNVLREAKGTSALRRLLSQFSSLLVVSLVIAAVVSALLGEVIDAVVIFAVVLLSGGMGFLQEWRAERAIAALKRMAAPQADVVRDGRHVKVPSAELVPGDVLILQTGDRIPADCRIIEAASLKIDESALTGESAPAGKAPDRLEREDLPLGDRGNMGYMATIITYGRGRGLVVATGMNTEFGHIAKMIQDVPSEKTPLEARLDAIGKGLALIALAACLGGASLGVAKGYPVLDMFLWGVSLAVAAVPEALPAVVTGALAIGAKRMARRHAVVKRLPAVETLGGVTVICSDKTGTLTRNEMTVRGLWAAQRLYDVSGAGYAPQGDFHSAGATVDPASDAVLRRLAEVGLQCNDATLTQEGSSWRLTGDPTEGALVALARKAGLGARCSRVSEAPFDSERKLMSVVCPEEGGYATYTKGAPEAVLARCTHIVIGEGHCQTLSPETRRDVLQTAERMAGDALRVLGFAFRRTATPPESTPEEMERELTFVGLQAMMDPPREEAKEAIARCRSAGIKPVMITGDHQTTAAVIARELGLLRQGDEIVSGEDLDRMSDDELERRIHAIAVHARVSPEHKLRIVNAFKKRGEVVAMTGDGVNDAPALKRADIGVAMGITGTDVTKEAGDMILADDNFATIVAAVEEGRAIYDNIRKYLIFLLSCNIAEIVILVGAFFVGLPLPLIAIQILYVNLSTDGLPALALGVDPPAPGIMTRPPRLRHEAVFDRRAIILMAVIAAWMGAVLLSLFAYYLPLDPSGATLLKAQSAMFAGMILFELFNAFNCRSDRQSGFKVGFFGNKWLNAATLWEMGLLLMLVEIPALQRIFHTTGLTWRDWLVVVPLALTIIPVVETAKWALNRRPSTA